MGLRRGGWRAAASQRQESLPPLPALQPNVDDDIYNHQPSFTLPIIALVIITILNDGCMITIAYDNVVRRAPW